MIPFAPLRSRSFRALARTPARSTSASRPSLRSVRRSRARLGTSLTALAILGLGSLFGMTSQLLAQLPPGDPAPYRAAIDRIDFLVGEWRGEGWIAMGPQGRKTFTSWEKVERKLGGSALLVEGIHHHSSTAADTEGDAETGKESLLVHHALAVISWSAADQQYRFVSSLFDRDGGAYAGHVDEDGSFVWEIEVPDRTIRFTIRLDEEGRWVEDGHISMDDGQSWFPFFHMTLERVDGS